MTSRFVVFDTESDGLAYEATKFHILVWTEDGETFHDTKDYDEITKFFLQEDVIFICHNAIGHDMPLANRLLGLNLKYQQFWDTLALSWYLFPDRNRHGLEWIAKEYGLEKPKVDDWQNVTYEQMKHRCTEDVKVNWLEFIRQRDRLDEIYNGKDYS